MSRKITNEEFQQAFDLAYILHPVLEVALRVTMDACDVLTLLEGTQARRRRSTSHYKTVIPSERLLQFAVFLVSYIRELDQESPRPRMEPKYRPTRDDLVVRYVKHLIWKTTLLSWRYVAVGIGCLLYSYKPSAIADLFLFEASNLGHLKMRIARDLIKRFSHSGALSAEGRGIRTRPANEHDRMMVQQALHAFTPWHSAHIAPPSKDTLIIETLTKEKYPISDWDRKHALIDPQCAGFEHLVNEFNGYFTSIRQTLTDPLESLVVPDFEGAPNPPLQRFNRRLLSESEKMLLQERHTPSGPWAYDQDALYFYLRGLGLTDNPFEEISLTLEDAADWDGRYDACIELDGRAVDFGISTRTDWSQSRRGAPTFFPVGTTMVDRGRMIIVEEEFGDLVAPDTAEVELTHRPVVMVIGHVDHGKMALLDAIRSTVVAGGEAGPSRRGSFSEVFDGQHQSGNSGQVLEGLDSGDEGDAIKLFDKLMLEFEKQLRRVASGWGDAAEAEDMTQELLILVWKAFDQCEAETNVRHYIFKMLSHVLRFHHRDNMMRRQHRYVKVIDFGLVKRTERLENTDTEASTSEKCNTNPGLVMGTVNYQSPDHAIGHTPDSRTDIWRLGVVLYEMITGGVNAAEASPWIGTGGPKEGPTGLFAGPSEIRSEISCTWKSLSDRAPGPRKNGEGIMPSRWLRVWVSKPANVIPGGSRRSFMIEQWSPTDALPLTAFVVTPRGLSRTIGIDDTWVILHRPIGFEPRADLARRRSRQSAAAPPDWCDTLGARRILDSLLISQEERDETREQSACRVDPWIERTDWYDSLRARRILDSIFISQEECDETREQSTCRVDPSIELESSYKTVFLKSDLTATIEGSSWATH